VKAYLDTNILRQLNKIPEKTGLELICSQLGIMELISGMTSETEFLIRKSALSNIKSRNISIIWESTLTLQSKAFALDVPDYDVPATQMLMDALIQTETFDEAKKIGIDHGGNIYSIATFIDYDNMLVDDSLDAFSGTLKISKEDRKTLRDQPYCVHIIDDYAKLIASEFLQKYGVEKSSDRYAKSIEHFNKFGSLKNYIRCLASYTLDAMEGGGPSGKNDGFDIAHLAYVDDIDFFVSNDKIYRRLKKNLYSVKFITFDEFAWHFFRN